MGKPLLPLCAIPSVATKDGDAGYTAKFYLPFYGYWTASGEVLTWPEQTLRQDATMRIGGVTTPNTFQKDCCTCAAGGDQLLLIDERLR